MKFQLAINLERMDDSLDMKDVARHTLEMVQMAEDGGFHFALARLVWRRPIGTPSKWRGKRRLLI